MPRCGNKIQLQQRRQCKYTSAITAKQSQKVVQRQRQRCVAATHCNCNNALTTTQLRQCDNTLTTVRNLRLLRQACEDGAALSARPGWLRGHAWPHALGHPGLVNNLGLLLQDEGELAPSTTTKPCLDRRIRTP